MPRSTRRHRSLSEMAEELRSGIIDPPFPERTIPTEQAPPENIQQLAPGTGVVMQNGSNYEVTWSGTSGSGYVLDPNTYVTIRNGSLPEIDWGSGISPSPARVRSRRQGRREPSHHGRDLPSCGYDLKFTLQYSHEDVGVVKILVNAMPADVNNFNRERQSTLIRQELFDNEAMRRQTIIGLFERHIENFTHYLHRPPVVHQWVQVTSFSDTELRQYLRGWLPDYSNIYSGEIERATGDGYDIAFKISVFERPPTRDNQDRYTIEVVSSHCRPESRNDRFFGQHWQPETLSMTIADPMSNQLNGRIRMLIGQHISMWANYLELAVPGSRALRVDPRVVWSHPYSSQTQVLLQHWMLVTATIRAEMQRANISPDRSHLHITVNPNRMEGDTRNFPPQETFTWSNVPPGERPEMYFRHLLALAAEHYQRSGIYDIVFSDNVALSFPNTNVRYVDTRPYLPESVLNPNLQLSPQVTIRASTSPEWQEKISNGMVVTNRNPKKLP